MRAEVANGIQRKVPFVYTAEGNRVANILWEEMMKELSFANVQQTLSTWAMRTIEDDT